MRISFYVIFIGISFSDFLINNARAEHCTERCAPGNARRSVPPGSQLNPPPTTCSEWCLYELALNSVAAGCLFYPHPRLARPTRTTSPPPPASPGQTPASTARVLPQTTTLVRERHTGACVVVRGRCWYNFGSPPNSDSSVARCNLTHSCTPSHPPPPCMDLT